MNSVQAATNFDGYQWLFGPNRGVSEDAVELQVKIMRLSSDEPQSMILDKQKLLQELYEVFRECSEVNWDNYGARATNLDFFSEALRFLKTLPLTLTRPELTVDPDGEIAFEWYGDRSRRVFSVSVGSNNELTYAGIFGSSKSNGNEYFGDELPKTILDNIRRVFL
jgi:hypothetical protein